ncbi:oligopeptide transporter, OPT family [Porphyromonas miyakawae]|uniref:Oligopeptide transporter, OPT family n=1 Tax=Porphyromonas miyakawae TaxID=3137470 RepID=A0ABQ0E3I8_9PORP
MPQEVKNKLPENAYRALKPGETYEPIMPANSRPKEVTPYSVLMGVLMAILFSAACAYLGLKVGQVFEAAIPIAILAVGIGSLSGKKNMLGQNVIIQSIGASSGVIVAGAIFTLPALYILELEAGFWQIFLSSLLGGFLGILLLIPFRKYFVQEMHGKYPFPEATATTEVLVTGESAGKQTIVLAISGLIGGLYDFIIGSIGLWAEELSTRMLSWGASFAERTKMVFKVNTGAAVLGLGYIIGLPYATIICAGSFLVWFVIIPLIGYFAPGMTMPVGDGITATIGQMNAEQIFAAYARPLGIGGIAMAGIIGILRSSKIIGRAIKLAATEFGGNRGSAVDLKRTEQDLSMRFIVLAIVAVLVAVLLFIQFGVTANIYQTLISLLIIFVITFLFTTVAANAIAIVGSNPVSGMTLMTLILTSIALVGIGLNGERGMLAAMVIGGIVCTALSMAGGFITDLKIGYWLGTTPKHQERWKFLGTTVSALTVAGVMLVLNKAYGFTGEHALVAPQANAMAAVIKPLMEGGETPWILYGAGAILALILTAIKVPALPFALGMFIPLQLNAPLLIGGLVSYLVSTRSKDEALNKLRKDKGTLIASGFIAGGALMGVVSAILKFAGVDMMQQEWLATSSANLVTLLVYLAIIAYFLFASLRVKKTTEQ